MFFVYLVLGLAIFGAGLFLVPGWWKAAWLAGWLAFVALFPVLLARVLDPLNVRRIAHQLAATGATEIEVRPFPNHYGAHYLLDGVRYYARYKVKRGRITRAGAKPRRLCK